MTRAARSITRTMTITAAVVAAMLVIGLPAMEFAVAYRYLVGAMEIQAEVSADQARRVVMDNPDMWFYEQIRLAELLERRSADRVPERRRLLDMMGHVVTESADRLLPPIVTRRHVIYDAGVPVAEIEIARSLRPVLLETGAALAAALAVAALVFTALRTIPLRAIRGAYKSLAESERRYRSLYESMREGMALHRIVYDGEQRAVSFSVVDANPAGARMLGIEPERLVGMDAALLLGGALTPFLSDMLRAATVNERFTFELPLTDRGRTLYVSVFSPAPGHFGTLLEDVTEQKATEASHRQLQEQLNQAQKMEAVGRLAGGVAHDFNNILTVILSLASELAATLRGEPLELASGIVQAGRRATSLTRQLLSFSHKQVLRPEVLRVEEVVTSLASMIRRLIGEDVQLSLEVVPDAGCICMDPSQLEQVLVNLAVNARDAMPEGGKLAIQVRTADVAAADRPGLAPGAYVLLSVADTGAGMDEATRLRIFEPFFTTKPKGKGTGLGLAMVFRAVQQGGGHIDVATRVGEGTTFTILLPRVEPPAGARSAPRPLALAGGGERILVVEDEPQLRAAVRRFLVSGGYSVVEAATGDEALAAFQADDSVDLVLTDLVMPGMSGTALGREIRSRRAVPVLYMSGYSEEVVSGAERLAPELFLQKPFDRGPLLERVRAALAEAGKSSGAGAADPKRAGTAV